MQIREETNTYHSDKENLKCYHCGDDCKGSTLQLEDKHFCCQGCMTVFQLLETEGMADYYCYDQAPGMKMLQGASLEKFRYLESDKIVAEILDFRSDEHSRVQLFVPQIHCSSCIWLLENLHKLNPAVISSQVNFSKKTVTVNFRESNLSFKDLVILLATVGYEPSISLANQKEKKKEDKSLYFKIGVAGFCFGNIMLLSFPEYLGIGDSDFEHFERFFAYLMLVMSLPVTLYCATDYYSSAINGLSHKQINIDVPISLGIAVLFGRSLFEIFTATGAGYLDSLSGLVFFLLVGKWYQSKIYDALRFERDYESYFPIAVTVFEKGEEKSIPLKDLEIGDTIVLRNQELIPADARLLSETANLDYSFVTGESELHRKSKGDFLYAGGKHVGPSIQMEILKEVKQSYLTQLWNQQAFKEESKGTHSIINVVSKYFTAAILAIATIAGIIWYLIDATQTFNVVSAILIIACPCALALTIPFTLGNTIRIMGRKGLFAKNVESVEEMGNIQHIVFDKTGTITNTDNVNLSFEGKSLNDEELGMAKSLAGQSAHPLSTSLYKNLKGNVVPVAGFKEILGRGTAGLIANHEVKLGNAVFVEAEDDGAAFTKVYLSIDGAVKGYFKFQNEIRSGFDEQWKSLKNDYQLHLLSGDTNKEKERFANYFENSKMHFNQSPQDKLNFIQNLQKEGGKVLMVGDGLNDAGALKKSDVGIALAENVYAFSPACDGILAAENFSKLGGFLRYAKASMKVVYGGFILSFLYNFVGISLACMNLIDPLVSAILMPLSSVTVVLFSTLGSNIIASKMFR